MDYAGNELFINFVKTVFRELQTDDGASVLMKSVDCVDRFDLAFGDFISTIFTFRQCIGGLHYYNLKLFFRDCTLNVRNVCALLLYHCKKIKQTCGNFFIAILHAYSFMDILIIFCKHKNLADFYNQRRIDVCCENLFSYLFMEDFEQNGGMEGLKNFLCSHDMDTIFNFIKSCYIEDGFFTSRITLTSENKIFTYGENVQEPSKVLREKILKVYLRLAPNNLTNHLRSLAQTLESVTETGSSSNDSSEDLIISEKEEFISLLDRAVTP